MSDDQSENNAGGRPTKYQPEYAKQAKKLCELGATDCELADFFEVNVKTIYNWKNNYREFLQAIRVSKEHADDRVERSLYHQALGYEGKDGKFIPANTTAALFWLKNRRSQEWRDKVDVEQTMSEDNPLMNVLKDIANQGLGLNNGGDE